MALSKQSAARLLLLLLIAILPLAAQIESIEMDGPTLPVGQYRLAQVHATLHYASVMPDSTRLTVDLIVSSSEDSALTIPMFRAGDGADRGSWQARWTPRESGAYRYRVQVRASSGIIAESNAKRLWVYGTTADGFLQVDTSRMNCFRFDSGRRFRGIGENICWVSDTTSYEYYFRQLSRAGGNVARIWMCPWNLALEWTPRPLGIYDPVVAKELDEILALAQHFGIYLMMCIDFHGVVLKGAGHFNENNWADNPYNVSNGGPCDSAAVFFSDSTAKDFYKQRLRYLVARYSYSPQILAWEFWNEVDLTAGEPQAVAAWHAEMVDYLRQMDPHQHMITTSFAGIQLRSGSAYEKIWELPGIDFTQSHLYNRSDLAAVIHTQVEQHVQAYQKPHIVGEFGSNSTGAMATRQSDPQHIAIRNGLISGVFADTPIMPLSWWWDEIIETDNLYHLFEPAVRLLQLLGDPGEHIEVLQATKVGQPAKVPPDSDLVLYPGKGWGHNQDSLFVFSDTFGIENKQNIPAFLYGLDSLKVKMRQPPEFLVEYQDSGRFEVLIGNISRNGLLRIYVDDSLALETYLPVGEGEGPWKESWWLEEYELWQARYDQVFGIEVAPGKHAIRVQNDSLDWIGVREYRFLNSGMGWPQVLVDKGLRRGDSQLHWLRDESWNWRDVQVRCEPDSITNAKMEIAHLAAGMHEVLWLSAENGRSLQSQSIEVAETGKLQLAVPAFRGDIALFISPLPFYRRWLWLGIVVLVGIFAAALVLAKQWFRGLAD